MHERSGLFKPGEKAPATGAYVCHICALRGERSTCEIEEGAMFLACPKCLERKVPEWDMTWTHDDPERKRKRFPIPWPGSLEKRG